MNLFKDENEEIELDELIRRFPESRYKSWMTKLRDYGQFVTRCYTETKEENEILRTLNAELTQKLADYATNSNLPISG